MICPVCRRNVGTKDGKVLRHLPLYKARQAELPTHEQIEAHRMTSPGTAWRDASCTCGWTGIDYWPHQTAMILALFRDSEVPL